MGRTAGSTQEEVFAIADQLAARGQEVTAKGLRDAIGQGSYSTFVAHLKEWKEQRQTEQAPIAIEMPEAVKAAFADCWVAATKEATKVMATIRESADADIAEANKGREEALTVISQLEAESEASREAALLLEAKIEEVTGNAHELDKTIASMSAGNQMLQTRNESLEKELSQVRGQLDAARDEKAQDIQRLTTEHAQQLTAAQDLAESGRGTIERLRAELEKANTRAEEISARERAKIEQAAKATTEAAHLAKQLASLADEKDALASKLANALQSADEAHSRASFAAGELKALRDKIPTGDSKPLRSAKPVSKPSDKKPSTRVKKPT